MTDLERLSLTLGITDEEMLRSLLEDAEADVLAYTNRRTLPDVLRKTVRDLAVIAYNRRGTEGESGRSEGGESYSFEDMPESIKARLNRYRLARVGGHTFEAVKE